MWSFALQLTELVEQLKAQLELEEVSDNPDNIATVLTNLKHQGEATLDSIHTAIDEGETIVEELKLASADGVDSSSLHHVEKVIKELDRVRRAIEHSWSRRRQQLELWLQLREFERAAKQVLKHEDIFSYFVFITHVGISSYRIRLAYNSSVFQLLRF